jgi:hypothetical protein
MDRKGLDRNSSSLIGVLASHLTGGAGGKPKETWDRAVGRTSDIPSQPLRRRGSTSSLSQLHDKMPRRCKGTTTAARLSSAYCVNTHFTCGRSTKTSDYRLPRRATSQQVAGVWGSVSRPPTITDGMPLLLATATPRHGSVDELENNDYKNCYCYIIIIIIIIINWGLLSL